MKSMTGFGKNSFTFEGKTVSIEIRTLNSKQIDLSVRLSASFREKESEIRSFVVKELERGKIDVNISLEKTEKQPISINTELAKSYYEHLTMLSQELNNPVTSDIFIQTLRMPEVISTAHEEYSEEFWKQFFCTLSQTCADVNRFRQQEGAHLEKDFEKRIALIDAMVEEVTPFEEERVPQLRKKMEEAIEKLSLTDKYDKNRFEQEMIFYIEKLDITEEKVRLRKHCSYFLETMSQNESNGKKLGFILQEIGREVNTLGSKCNHFNIQQIVVRMKDEVEKMKEQLANIL